MSTRAVIFKVLSSGEVHGVYCHCDGGLDCVGAILNLAYHDPAKVDQLLALGDLLALGMEVEAGPRLPIYEHVIAYHLITVNLGMTPAILPTTSCTIS